MSKLLTCISSELEIPEDCNVGGVIAMSTAALIIARLDDAIGQTGTMTNRLTTGKDKKG